MRTRAHPVKASERTARADPSPHRMEPKAEDNISTEEGIEALRLRLARRIQTLRRMSRRCREPVCKRARRCAGPDLRCMRDGPRKPVSAERAARRMAYIQRLLRKRIAELEE